MFNYILTPLDGSELARDILCQVEELARMSGGAIHLLHVVHINRFPGMAADADLEAREVETGQAYLEKTAASLREKGLEVQAHIRVGHAAEEILDHAENFADVVVMTTHGYGGVKRWALGSVADRVMRRSKKPLLLFRPDEGCKIL